MVEAANLKKLSDFDNKSLLIVDDDNPFRDRLARAMEKKGFEVFYLSISRFSLFFICPRFHLGLYRINFNNQVLQNNGFYIPEFISQEEFNDIISTSNKKCNLN